MILPFAAACRAFAPPSLPFRTPAPALDLIQRYTADVPAWPELPQRDASEQSLRYSTLGMPGLQIDLRSSQVLLRRNDLLLAIGELDLAYLENDLDYAAFVPGQAAGLDALLRREGRLPGAFALQGRLAGPISLALQIIDDQQRPIIHDSLLFDALTRYLRLRAGWQDAQLAEKAPATIICLEEPFLDQVGSPFLALDWDAALLAIDEVFAGVGGCRGLLVGGEVPWARLLETSVELIIVDPATQEAGLAAAAAALTRFLDRKGVVVYAVVPNQPQELEAASAAALGAALAAFFERLVALGLALDVLAAAAFVTTRGSLGALEPAQAERALALTAELSALLRRQYGFS